MDKVSVIVTCYNHAPYIEQCLNSIFMQTYENIQLIVINDGSVDDSKEIITSVIPKSPYSETMFINQENQGACWSRNKGLSLVDGEFVLFVDSDNYLDPKHIEKSLNRLAEKQADIAYCSLKNALTGDIVNEVPEYSFEKLLTVNYIDTCSLIRRSVLKNHQFDVALNRQFMQDFDFFLSLVMDGAVPVKVPDLYINYRVLKDSVGNRGENHQQRQQWFEIYSYILNKYPAYTNTATMFVGSWYQELAKDYEELRKNNDKEIKKLELQVKKATEDYQVKARENEILNDKLNTTIQKYQVLDDLYLSIVHSSSWKYGRILTYPMRKLKTKFLKRKEIRNNGSVALTKSTYENWIETVESKDDIVTELSTKPLISILIPVYNVDEKWLTNAIESVQNQTYTNWEICIADDASTNKATIQCLQKLEKSSSKIKIIYRKENGHISEATNSALALASGEFIALMDNDDELAPNALYEIAKAINMNPELNLIYSDEDKIDEKGKRFDPHFKPNWSPDLLLNQNYISHLGVYRTSISKNIHGFRKGFEGAQDHDFVLRFVEKISEKTIYHIPKVLYHWRAIAGSTALQMTEKDYATDKGVEAIKEALFRRGRQATVTQGRYPGLYDISYKIIREALVSIVIPTKNGYDDVKKCIDSIIETTTYKNYEIILADNGSDDPKMFSLFDHYQEVLKSRFKYVLIDIPFNYSRINNLAVRHTSGEYVLFLNNDTSVITPTWIEEMLGFAQFPEIGCVGAKLWYFDDTIQHGGVVLGVGGVAGHSFLNARKNDPGYFSRLYTDYDYTAVTAACLMIRKEFFEAVGGFDEKFEIAFNDIDFCIRVYESGKRNVWAHKAELYHYESKSRGYEDTEEKQRRFNGEIQHMIQRHEDILFADPAYNPNFDLNASPFTTLKKV